jgi:fumarate reductase subunit D
VHTRNGCSLNRAAAPSSPLNPSMNIRILGKVSIGLLLTARTAFASPLSVLPLAEIPASLKTSFQTGLGIVFMIGFIWGVIKIWAGADKMSKGDADGKMGIVSGIIIAGAAAIMSAMFYIFGMSDGALTPQF